LAGAVSNLESVDIVIVGSGMGGATCAAGLAPSGASVLILERGARLKDSADARDPRAIFQRGVFRPQESWIDGAGEAFNPGNYYYVGGNTKLYGAVLLRYRAQDFAPTAHREGSTVGWPFAYDELEPWYTRAEKLHRVHGALGFDKTEPHHSEPFPFGPVPDEPVIAQVRERMKRFGLHPFPLPLGLDLEAWLRRAPTPWDAFPDTGTGKMDAESCRLAEALRYPNVELRENVKVERLVLEPDGRRHRSIPIWVTRSRDSVRTAGAI
jgi:choline dehydrogenase-like flavoprotein